MAKRQRRSKGDGAVYQNAKGIWTGYVTLGNAENGRPKRRYVYGKTSAEVREKLDKLRSDARSGLLCDPTRITVRQFLADWLDTVARPSIKPSTYIRYERIVRLYIVPYLGGFQLTKLTPLHIQGSFVDMRKDGLSPSAQESAFVILRAALGTAVKWALVPRNVCAAVEKPKVPKKEFQVFSPDEARRFLDAAKDDRYYALYVLALTMGIRQGELFGLTWRDLDLDKGTIRVQRTLADLNGTLEVGETKNKKQRGLLLPKIALEALRIHKAELLSEGIKSDLIFCDTQGGPIRRNNFSRRSFKPLLKKARLPNIRFHDLRHTAATLLLGEQVQEKVIQEILGHSNIKVTMDTYAHFKTWMQRPAIDKMDAIFA